MGLYLETGPLGVINIKGGLEGGPKFNRVGALVRRGRDSRDLSLCMQKRDEDRWGHSKKAAICKLSSEASEETKSVDNWILDFPASKTMRN